MIERTIDVHCHYLPPALIDLLQVEGPQHSIHITKKDGKRFASLAGRSTQAIPGGMLDLEERLRWMDQCGIDLQIVSAWMDFSSYVLAPDDGLWLASSLNELTLEAIAPHADRFAAMAAVPMQEPKLAAEELRRAVRELGMVGVEIGTSIGGDELDDESLTPFWSEAEHLDVAVLVHPFSSRGLGADRLQRYSLANSVSNPAEETVAASYLILGGVLERHPSLRVCLTHGGGFLPYQIGRQDRSLVATPHLVATNLSKPPSSFLPRFLYDTIVHSPEALRFLVDRVGHDRIVMGSDYPFPMGDPDPLATIDAAGLEGSVKRAILFENAAREWPAAVAARSS
jgi:aminocarboxymuconate-semialdehyde decarboxylase